MKKKFNWFARFATLIVALVLFSTLAAEAQMLKYTSFMSGSSVTLTNASTNSFGGANIIYASREALTNVMSGTSNYQSGTLWLTNAYNYVYGNAWADVDLAAISAGVTPNQAVTVTLRGAFTTTTNTITMGYVKVGDGVYPSTTAQDKFAFTFSANGTNLVTITTNLPTGLTQGTKKLRWDYTYVTSATTATNVNIISHGLVAP
jgi:hypothetical protein